LIPRKSPYVVKYHDSELESEQRQVVEGSQKLVFSWGRGKDGCLGLPKLKDQCIPSLISRSLDIEVTDIKAGKEHLLMLEGSRVLSWGKNSFGQLGVEASLVAEPTVV
jgi:alpha-tubulin suppressor-like RCC1 family protein